jgi:hypothetical protein
LSSEIALKVSETETNFMLYPFFMYNISYVDEIYIILMIDKINEYILR